MICRTQITEAHPNPERVELFGDSGHTLAEFQRYGISANVGWLLANVPSIHSVVGRGLAYSLLMQPAESSVEDRPLVFRPLSDATHSNSLVAAMPVGISRSAMVSEAVACLHAQWK